MHNNDEKLNFIMRLYHVSEPAARQILQEIEEASSEAEISLNAYFSYIESLSNRKDKLAAT